MTIFKAKVKIRVIYKQHTIAVTIHDEVWITGFGTPIWAEDIDEAKDTLDFLTRRVA